MKVLKKNNLIKKIAIIILFIMCFNILIPNGIVTAKSWAEETADKKNTPGGSLFQPIMDFLVFLADSILNVLQHNFITLWDVVYSPTAKSTGTFSWGWLGVALLAVVAIAYGVACIYSGGAALGAAGAIKTILVGCMWGVGGVAATVHSFGEFSDLRAGEFDIPFIMYNPYSIFSGDIPALDINFINPREPVEYSRETISDLTVTDFVSENGEQNEFNIGTWNDYNVIFKTTTYQSYYGNYVGWLEVKDESSKNEYSKEVLSVEELYDESVIRSFVTGLYSEKTARDYIVEQSLNSSFFVEAQGDNEEHLKKFTILDKEYSIVTKKNPGYVMEGYLWTIYDDKKTDSITYNFNSASSDTYSGCKSLVQYIYEDISNILYEYSDLEVQEKIDHDVKEIKEKLESMFNNVSHQDITYQSSASILQSSIATWYKVLRRVALVGLLSVLVYVGIRIILTAAAADKAKYKKMFIDWLVAVCMLFVLHYIMILILTLSTSLTEIFNEEGALNMVFELPADSTLGGEPLSNFAVDTLNEDDSRQYSYITVSEEGAPLWNGEFMGYIRLKAGSSWVRNQMAYGLMYLVLVIYVITFTFMYLRRVLYMAFLTMIAPLIALTYPIDKIKDGQAQAFGMWLREYIFNALIQPVHLIIYTMVLSNVINLAVDHPVYALVALGFMLPAEKFIRSMFGFQKASTIDKAGGVLGGAALMTAINKLSKLGKKKGDKTEDKGKDLIRTADKGNKGVDLPDIDLGENSGDSGNVRMNNRNADMNSYALGDSNNTTNGSQDYTLDYNLEHNDDSSTFSHYNNMGYDENGNDTYLSANNEQGNNIASNSTSSERNKPSIRNRMANAMVSMGNRGKNRILKAKPLRTVGRYTAMAAGAATLGMAGLAAGIATGDFGNVMKYTGGAAGVGAALGKNIGDRAMDKASQVKDDFMEGYKGSEEYNNEKLDREYFNGQGYQEMLDNSSLMPHLSGRERAQALRQEIESYRASGLTDNKQIASCMKAGLSSAEGVIALQMSNKLKGMNLDSNGKDVYKQLYKNHLSSQFDSSKVDSIWNVIEANM